MGPVIGTKLALPILLMADLEELLLYDIDLKPYFWQGYIDDIFLIWEHDDKSLKFILEKINNVSLTINFTAEWSYSSINFLDVKVVLKNRSMITDLYVTPKDTHQ